MKLYNRIRRGSVSRSDIQSIILGNVDSDVRFTMYVSPTSDTCHEIIGAKFNEVQRDMLDENNGVGLNLVFVAPEMQSRASQLSFDSIRVAKSIIRKEEISSTDVSEACYAIHDSENNDVLIEFLQNVYQVPFDSLTYDKLFNIVNDVGADEEYIRRSIETGKYRPVVRKSTEEWLWMIPDDDDLFEPLEAVMYINGTWIPDCNVNSMRDNVIAGRRLMEEEIELPEEAREKLLGDSDMKMSDLR